MWDKCKRYNLQIARAVVLLLATSFWFLLSQTVSEKKQTYQQLNSSLVSQLKRLEKLEAMAIEAEYYISSFEAYMPVTQYESEDRLYLLDELESLRIKNKIPLLTYTISPNQVYKYRDRLLKDKGVRVNVSSVKLKMGLMHAEDLLRVVDDLDSLKGFKYVLTGCQLSRTQQAKTPDLKSLAPNIDASCELIWFTFKVT